MSNNARTQCKRVLRHLHGLWKKSIVSYLLLGAFRVSSRKRNGFYIIRKKQSNEGAESPRGYLWFIDFFFDFGNDGFDPNYCKTIV